MLSSSRTMQQSLQHTCYLVASPVASRKRFAGKNVLWACTRHSQRAARQCCHAGMGIGFTKELIIPSNQPQIAIPSNAYGLSIRQMAALGLTDESVAKRLEPQEVSRPFAH